MVEEGGDEDFEEVEAVNVNSEADAVNGNEEDVQTNERLLPVQIPNPAMVVYKAKESPHGCDDESPASNEEDSEGDSDYLPGDDCSLDDDDEEGAAIERHYKDLKKKLRTSKVASLDDVTFGGHKTNANMAAGTNEGDGNDTEYIDSDDEESVEEGSDGELRVRGSNNARFKKKPGYPTFELGMKFSCKSQFKKAITAYALAERKVINFVKDDPKRVRAKCDWHSCP